VAQGIYNLFVSFLNTLSAVVNTVAGWLWGAVKTMVIAPAQSALVNAVAFMQRKLFGTIYIAALVKLYEIEIKSFVEKPSLKKVLLMVAKPLLLYIGLSIMFGTLQGMGLMPAVQPGPLIAPTAPTPTPIAGVPALPTAPTGVEVKEVLRFSGTARGSAALVQVLSDVARFTGTAAGVVPQVLPVPSDAVRTSLATTYTTTVRPTFVQDVVRSTLNAGMARPVTAAPKDVLRSALAAKGVVLLTARPSDTIYSSLRALWSTLPTAKAGDVIRSMYGVEWERVTLASAGDVVRSSLKVTYGYPRIVVLIGDAPPHSAPSGLTLGIFTSAYGGDPGRDAVMFTDDDLDYAPVVRSLAEKGIRVFGVYYPHLTGSIGQDALANFQYVTTQTNGKLYYGDTSWHTQMVDDILAMLPPGMGADIAFVVDVTASMAISIEDVKAKIKSVIDALPTDRDFRFGLASFRDYPGYYSSYGYSAYYGSPGDWPWMMHVDLTADRSAVKSAVDALEAGGGADGPECYTRALYESQFFSWRY
jgi:hypothetical protein